MNLLGTPWTVPLCLRPQTSHKIAWFVYGWIEREHVLNVTACADWWTRALGLSAAQLKVPSQRIGNTVPQVEPQVLVHDSDRAKTKWHGSLRQVESLS